LLTSAAMTFQFAYALANATSIRVGNLLGDENSKQASIAANLSIMIAFAFSCMTCTMYVIFRKSWAYIFNDDPEVINLVASIIPIIAVLQFVDFNGGVTAGIMRAKGQQSIGALLNFIAYYILGLPLGVWLAFRWNFGLHGLWIGVTVSLAYCAAIGTFLCLRTDWDQEVVKVKERIAEEERLRKIAADEENRLPN